MAKQQMYQRYVFKIHSQDILRAKKRNLNISVDEGRRRQYIVTLADSQVFRFIDDIKSIDRAESLTRYKELTAELHNIRKEKRTPEAKARVKKIYSELEHIQLVNEYLCVIMDRPGDILKLSQGFTFNGREFKRLVGTPNGVKRSTVVYTSLWNELNERLDNGRDKSKELIPAKFEAYKALAFSASTPVSYPKGVLVVPDLEFTFNADIIELRDNPGGEPVIQRKNEEVPINASDGYGIMCPALSARWSEELRTGYMMSGCCIRNSFLKGMSYTFDFHRFAGEVAKRYNVTDAWGNKHDIRDIELIVTTSMLKLWDSYKSWDNYYGECISHGYTFSVTKTAPRTVENTRALNYQFIQSYDLTDSDIYDLVSPAINEIKSVLHENVDKAILFLRGLSVNEDNVLDGLNDDYVKALMIEPGMIEDPYVIDHINSMISKRITDAKIGVIGVHGNYQLLSFDPYALCQHVFDIIDDTGSCGLLRKGEIYSRYWIDDKAERVAVFRAPMSCHNNIKVLKVHSSQEAQDWYRYMPTVAILNCHDTTTHTLNGADTDGDIIYLTNNSILLEHTRDVPPLICIQRKGKKEIITEESLMKSNMLSFGDTIGAVTNRITTMFDIQARFKKDSEEYKTLEYRIMCGQQYQQGSIDACKGIISEPMPKSWYTLQRIDPEKDTEEVCRKKAFSNSVCANKKPYFMNYIYPEQKAEYNRFVKNCDLCGVVDHRKSIDEIRRKANPTEAEADFLKYYDKLYPVSDGNCVMNRLCHMVEKEFDGYVCYIKKHSGFDYSVLKCDSDYSKDDYGSVKKIYKEYLKELEAIKPHNKTQAQKEDYLLKMNALNEAYKRKCIEACSNEYELCNIVLDICYHAGGSKNFAWDMCGSVIIENLLKRNRYMIHYLEADPIGNVEYQGRRFSRKAVCLKGESIVADNE